MKKAVFAVSILLAVLSVIGCDYQPQIINADIGKEFIFNTSAGKEFIINLDANPGTGHSWQEQYDNTLLKLVDAQYRPGDNPSGLVGTGGTQYFHFEAIKTGKTEIVLTYKQPWEQQVADQKVFTVIID